MPLARGSRPSRWQVNLGSGNEPLEGYVNVDRRRSPGVALVADVRQLPFATGSIDHIHASSLLEHFDNPYQVLDEVHRVLGPQAAATFRMPSPWSFLAGMDRTHAFLADLKLWRQILRGYFSHIHVTAEGVRYRDNPLLTLLNHGVVRVLRWFEFAQTWRFDCHTKHATSVHSYTPWWLEPDQASDTTQ